MKNISKDDIIKYGASIVPGFAEDQHNAKVLQLLVWYVNRDKKFETQSGYSLDKGLLLTGPYGTGKTDMLRALQRLMSYTKHFMKFKTAPPLYEIAEDFSAGGFNTLKKFRYGSWFFDELALKDKDQLKENVQHMGNKINISQTMVMQRHKCFIEQGEITHFTTNRSEAELEAYLGGLAFSRVTQMCNLITLIGPDRRPLAIPKKLLPPPPPKVETQEEKDFNRLTSALVLLETEIELKERKPINCMADIAKLDIKRHLYNSLFDSLAHFSIYNPIADRRKKVYLQSAETIIKTYVRSEFNKQEVKEYDFFVSQYTGIQGFSNLKSNSYYNLSVGLSKQMLINELVIQLEEMEIDPWLYAIERMTSSSHEHLYIMAEKLQKYRPK